MEANMIGHWDFIVVQADNLLAAEVGETIKKALNQLPEGAREGAQILITRFSPAASIISRGQSPLFAVGAMIFFFVPEKEPVPFVSVEDGDPEFLPEPWKATGQ